jgi:hypothetical protein
LIFALSFAGTALLIAQQPKTSSEEEKRQQFLKAREEMRTLPPKTSGEPAPKPKPKQERSAPPEKPEPRTSAPESKSDSKSESAPGPKPAKESAPRAVPSAAETKPKPAPQSTEKKATPDKPEQPAPSSKKSAPSKAPASKASKEEKPKESAPEPPTVKPTPVPPKPAEKAERTAAPKAEEEKPSAPPPAPAKPVASPEPQKPLAPPRTAIPPPPPQAPVTIEKSGVEDERGLQPAAPGGWFTRWKYLSKSVRQEIDRAPVQKHRWRYIVVHNSGTRQGSAKAFEYYHLYVRKMPNGLAYQFVIGNGSSSGDGEIEIGNRWRRQVNGGHVHSDYLNNIALGICLVGDFNRDKPTKRQIEALEELTRYLRMRVGKIDRQFAIVKAHREINPPRWPTDCPGDDFPYRWLHAKFD